jgi:hypothetical protein
MEQKELLEHSAAHAAVPGDSAIEDRESAQVSTEEEGAPAEVIELAGHVKEALAPVKAPPSVRDKLRVELVEIAQHRQRQDVRVEFPPRRREWAMGAVVALVGGALYLLFSRLQGPSQPDSKSQPADSR